MIDMRFNGLHETRQQVAIHFRFGVLSVEFLGVVNVQKGNRKQRVSLFTLRPEKGQIGEEEAGSLQNREFLVVQTRREYDLMTCGFDQLDGQEICELRQSLGLNPLKPLLLNQRVQGFNFLLQSVGQLQMKRLFCLAFGIRCAVAPVEKDDLFEEWQLVRVAPGQGFPPASLTSGHPARLGPLAGSPPLN